MLTGPTSSPFPFVLDRLCQIMAPEIVPNRCGARPARALQSWPSRPPALSMLHRAQPAASGWPCQA